MGKGKRWLGIRAAPRANRVGVPGSHSPPRNTDTGLGQQPIAGTVLLHALSRIWRDKTQTWPQGDARLACIPSICTALIGREKGEKPQKPSNAREQIWFLTALFFVMENSKGIQKTRWCCRDAGAVGGGSRVCALLTHPKSERSPSDAQPASSHERRVSVLLGFKKPLLLLKRLSSFPTETRVWAVKEHVNEENFPRAALLLSPKPSSFSLSYLYLFIKNKD